MVSGLNLGQTLLLNYNIDLFGRCLLYRIFVNDVASLMRLNSIDRFQSRGQQLCKLLGVKPGVGGGGEGGTAIYGLYTYVLL